jgi:hypothetical protein
MFIKQIRLLAVLFVFTIVAPCLRGADPIPTGYSVSVEFSPSPEDTEAYIVRALISDVVTNEILSSPKIIAKKGELGKVRIGSDASSYSIDILLDKAGKTGSYTFTASKSGKAVSILKGSISIQ